MKIWPNEPVPYSQLTLEQLRQAKSIIAACGREHITITYWSHQEGPDFRVPDKFDETRFDKLVEVEEQCRPGLIAFLGVKSATGQRDVKNAG